MLPFAARPSSILRVLAALALLLVGVGCGGKPVHVLDVTDNIARWKGPQTAAPTVRKQNAITVRLVGLPTMGAFLYPGEVTPLVPVPSQERGDEKKVFKEMLDANPRAMSGFLVKGVGEAAQIILHQNLLRYFEHATVELAPTAAAPSIPTIGGPRLVLIPGGFTRTAAFSWTATIPGTTPTTVDGVPRPSSAAGHLGWALPLAILTFPIGLSIVSPIFASIYKGMEEDKTIEAIDLAAAQLAAQLAGVPQPGMVVAGR